MKWQKSCIRSATDEPCLSDGRGDALRSLLSGDFDFFRPKKDELRATFGLVVAVFPTVTGFGGCPAVDFGLSVVR